MEFVQSAASTVSRLSYFEQGLLVAGTLAVAYVAWYVHGYATKSIFAAPKSAKPQPTHGVHRTGKSKVLLFGGTEFRGLVDGGSPFVGKVSGFLRAAGISHVHRPCNLMKAPKGKMPYLVHKCADPAKENKDVVVADSTFMISYLIRTFGAASKGATTGNVLRMGKMLLAPRDPVTGLTNARLADLAIESGEAPDGYPSSREWASAFNIRRMCEEALYFTVIPARWVWDDDNFRLVCAEAFQGIPAPVRVILEPWIRGQVAASVRAQGIARHSRSEVESMAKEMIDAVEAHLSDGRAFLTGAHLTDEDMAVFHFLEGQFRTACRHAPKQHILQHCPLIVAYTDRIRQEVYPEEAKAAPDMSQTGPAECIPMAIAAHARRQKQKDPNLVARFEGALAPLPDGDSEGEGGQAGAESRSAEAKDD